MTLEIYAVIPEHPNYAISNFGEVLNIKKQKFLKQSINSSGYKNVHLDGKFKYVHRLLAQAFIDNPENKAIIDHIDNDPLNNNLENLRWATVSENNRNLKMNVKNTSGVKGVVFNKQSNKWQAQIQHNNKFYGLGLYNTLEDARTARQAVANILFKEFTNNTEKQEIELNLNLKDIITSKKALVKLNLNFDDE